MKPAIFNTEMVRAILALIKKNTRRPFSKYLKKVIDAAYAMGEIGSNGIDSDFDNSDKKYLMSFAPYQVGDVIYVRETWSDYPQNYIWFKADFPLHWDADQTEHGDEVHIEADDVKWKPSIHMPKEHTRLFLRVKNVRIERLNEISEEDAIMEGLDYITFFNLENGKDKPMYRNYKYTSKKWTIYGLFSTAKESFISLWESIYGKNSFDNRWVWVIEFETITYVEVDYEI